MKAVYEEYKSHIKELLNNKVYIFSIIIVAILAYGFTITNFSIGVDDLCFDRYVTGGYIFAAGRWGTPLLYAILQIFEFTPFWLEMIVTILTVLMGIIFTAFLKKEFSNKLKTVHYIIATSMLISYPILHQSFIYQSTNLSVIISNLALIIIPILIYEHLPKKENLKMCLLFSIILPFFISMYESCCQTYICMVSIIAFIKIYNNIKDKQAVKNTIKYILLSITILVGGLIVNFLISNIIKSILDSNGMLQLDYSSKAIPWLDFNNNILLMLKDNVWLKIVEDFKNLQYIRTFIIFAFISLVITIIKGIKEKRLILIPIMLTIVLSNFIINLLQIRVLYRINTSWSIAIAFFSIFIIMNINDKTINRIVSAIFCIIVLFQTKQMNQAFYNDYVRYKKDANYGYYLANAIINECTDTTKPVVYLYQKRDGIHQNRINIDNGWSIFDWGAGAFGEPGAEITKFINSLGYNFKIATNEQREEAIYNLYSSRFEINSNDKIYETDKYIVVIINYII